MAERRVSFKLPNELDDTLTMLAEENERSKSSIVRQALRRHLEDLIDIREAEKAHAEWLESGRKTYSLDYARKLLEDRVD